MPTNIKVKYNKPYVYILDKTKKQILIVEVRITSFDNLRFVETEKKHKYDLLAYHYRAMYGYKTKFLPRYCKEGNSNNFLQTIQERVEYIQPNTSWNMNR